MELYSIEKLLLQNKPEQIVILEELLRLFSQSPYLSHAFVRGSITRNGLDRASDLDLVLAYDSDHYAEVVTCLNDLLGENLNVLFPGWLDSIVADFGGLGLVYIIERGGELFQVDIYLMPSESAAQLTSLAKAKLVYQRSTPRLLELDSQVKCRAVIEEYRRQQSTSRDYLVGAMVLSLLIHKRIKRGQMFLNYSESHLLNSNIRNFLRSVTDAKFVNYGWYHIQENLADSDIGQEQLNFLERLIRQSPVHNSVSLRRTMVEFLQFVRQLAPDIFYNLESQLRCFYRQSKFLNASEVEATWSRA